MKSKIILSESIKTTMEERGIFENDVYSVIDFAANGGTFLYSNDDNTRLAKKRIGNFTVYAEYSCDGENYSVTNVYSHRVSLTEDMEGEIA